MITYASFVIINGNGLLAKRYQVDCKSEDFQTIRDWLSMYIQDAVIVEGVNEADAISSAMQIANGKEFRQKIYVLNERPSSDSLRRHMINALGIDELIIDELV